MDYVALGLAVVTDDPNADLHLAFERAGATVYVIDDRPPVPRTPADPLTTALFFGGFIALAGGIIYFSEKQRKERQKFMTPCERSMDDCMHAMASRPYGYGGGYGYGYREPAVVIDL
jgi:hypothetical protein